jgi:hypothetical protein
MHSIKIHKIKDGVPYEKAAAGSFCEIIEAEDKSMVGMICVKPFCTNQATVLLNKPIASTDRTLGIKRVHQLRAGDSFTVTIN